MRRLASSKKNKTSCSWGGCTPQEILGAVGLQYRDCWPAELLAQWNEDVFSRTWAAILNQEERRASWPVLDDHALIGLPGDSVRAVKPHTEADPVGLLVQFLALFGVLAGPKPHLMLDGSWHALNEFAPLVGETSKARKGTAWAHVQAGFLTAFKRFDNNIISGRSSGEGLIWEVRDPVTRSAGMANWRP